MNDDLQLLDKDQLIQEVASKYGVILSSDDSIFHYLFLHDVILQQYQGMLNSKFLELQSGMATTQEQYLKQTKLLGERLGTATNNALHTTTASIEKRLLALFDEQYKRFATQHQQQAQNLEQTLKRMAWLILGSGLGAGIVILLSGYVGLLM